MKRTLLCTLAFLMISIPFFAKDKSASSSGTDDKIISTEKQLWEAWKNKDSKPFDDNLSPDSIDVDGSGVMDKAAIVKMIGSGNCDVKDYSFSDQKVTWLDKTTALLTYKVTQHATCDGKPIPENIVASSIYVKRNGKWWGVFHQESAAPPAGS